MHPFEEEQQMKKIMSLIVVLATSVALTGCLFGKKEEAAPEAPVMEAPAETEATDGATMDAAPTEAAPTEAETAQ